ncbi:MAG: CpaF family protein [Idiomarina sp.]|nr:CpaF family protein [Idiomarina sp.]
MGSQPARMQMMDWYQQLQHQVRALIDVRQTRVEQLSDKELSKLLSTLLTGAHVRAILPTGIDEQEVVQRLLDDLMGLGPLEGLLRDESVSEIMVNSPGEIYVERCGRLSLSSASFADEEAVRQIIERIVGGAGRRIDASSPMADARLQCGARVNVVIPPLALKGSSITIRKFSRKILAATDLCANGACSQKLADFLQLAVEQHRNIVVCGGTGTGKTTLLNILANWIRPGERVITIEDSAELQLNHNHLVSLEARPPNQEGQGQVSIRQLVINALRMRPDRIVVGECRGGESLDMLQAMNTGHAGSLTTLHANTPRDGLRRLEVMVMMAGMELPLVAIRQQIGSAIDLVVQLSRLSSGQRLITQVTEVQGIEGDVLSLADIFTLPHEVGVAPRASSEPLTAIPTGDIPLFVQALDDEQKSRALALLTEGSDSSYLVAGLAG